MLEFHFVDIQQDYIWQNYKNKNRRTQESHYLIKKHTTGKEEKNVYHKKKKKSVSVEPLMVIYNHSCFLISFDEFLGWNVYDFSMPFDAHCSKVFVLKFYFISLYTIQWLIVFFFLVSNFSFPFYSKTKLSNFQFKNKTSLMTCHSCSTLFLLVFRWFFFF